MDYSDNELDKKKNSAHFSFYHIKPLLNKKIEMHSKVQINKQYLFLNKKFISHFKR